MKKVPECRKAEMACFIKQWGSYPCNGQPPNLHQLGLSDPKGGDPLEWPEQIRVREFPEPVRRAVPA